MITPQGVCRRIYHSTISVGSFLILGIMMTHGLQMITTDVPQNVTVGEVTHKVTKATYPTLY